MMQSANVNVDTKIYAPLLKKCASGKGRAGVTNQLQCEGSLPLCLCEPNLLAVNSTGWSCSQRLQQFLNDVSG